MERELKSRLGTSWETAGRDSPQKANWDVPQTLLGAMVDHWNSVFRESLGQTERSLVDELKVVRNLWAHNEQCGSIDAVRAPRSFACFQSLLRAELVARAKR